MDFTYFGEPSIKISKLCLGTMTWGSQNSEKEAHQQIDLALDNGVNFLDTAEMYPTTPFNKIKPQGLTESMLGSWIKKNRQRDKIVIATKVVGKGFSAIRNGAPISSETIRLAIDNSLKELQTDYIDIYQLHWPNRGSYMFRKNWNYDPSKTKEDKETTLSHMYDVLECIQEQKRLGKIRHFGLSNETAWGTSQWLRTSEEFNLPRTVTLQNEYSLLCRFYDLDLAELSVQEKILLLAWSPLAAGLLSGKYRTEHSPEGSRRAVSSPNLGNRLSKNMWSAVECYREIANKFNIDMVQMAIAWCLTRPFMGSVIVGATNLNQLRNILKAADLNLSGDIMKQIKTVYMKYPVPF